MSLREVTTIAHTAQCKLHMAINRPDKKERDWRFVLGHAVVLDNLMLRLVEIEEGIEQSDHATGVKFKGAGGVKQSHHKPSPLAAQKSASPRRSPPPQRIDDSSSEEEMVDEENEDEEELGLMRFPSGSAKPPQPPQPPPLDPSDDDSSSSDEDLDDLMQPIFQDPDPEVVKKITGEKGNEDLAKSYNDMRNCPCSAHHKDAPVVKNFWELPQQGNAETGGKRLGLVEVAA